MGPFSVYLPRDPLDHLLFLLLRALPPTAPIMVCDWSFCFHISASERLPFPTSFLELLSLQSPLKIAGVDQEARWVPGIVLSSRGSL